MKFKIVLEAVKQWVNEEEERKLATHLTAPKKVCAPTFPFSTLKGNDDPAAIFENEVDSYGISHFAFSADGRHIFYTDSNSISILEMHDNELRSVGKMEGDEHSHDPTVIGVSPKGDYLVSGAVYLYITDAHCGEDFNDCEIVIWNAVTFTAEKLIQSELYARPVSFAFDPEGQILVSGHWRGDIVVFQVGGEWPVLHALWGGIIPNIVFLPVSMRREGEDSTCQFVVSYSQEGGTRVAKWEILDALSGEMLRASETGHYYCIESLVLCPPWGVITCSKYLDTSIVLWDVHAGTVLHRVKDVEANSLAVVQNSTLLSNSKNDSVLLWSLPRLEPISSLNMNARCIQVHASGLMFATCVSNRISVWCEQGFSLRYVVAQHCGLLLVDDDDDSDT